MVETTSFGPDFFTNNISQIRKEKLREPTTAESILAASNGFGSKGETDPKRDILNPRWLQLGWIVRASEGVYVNPPKDSNGNCIKNESLLKNKLGKARKINGIYLAESSIGFAPYETFERGQQDWNTFVEGGLARALEHSSGTAEILKQVASPEHYKDGVYVLGFTEPEEPLLRVVGLGSENPFYTRLMVTSFWERAVAGYAFGVQT